MLLLFANSFGQNFQGIAYYTSKTQLKDFNITSNDLTPEMKDQMMEKMKKARENKQKPSEEELFTMRSQQLDNQIAMKKSMKEMI